MRKRKFHPFQSPNYVISLSESHAIRADAMPLLLAAGLAIDTIYKEK